MYTSIAELYRLYKESQGICTDTRSLQAGQLFWALRGERFDGNQFALQALQAGAMAAVVDDPAIARADARCHLVEDSLQALQALAHHRRKQFNIPVIAITGSNGKTTTKELTRLALACRYRAFATPGNLNNHIGVPLTLLRMPSDSEIAVIELGANHEGEIAALCEIAAPTHGLITNIGMDHLEGFGSLEGVARANSELYYYLLQHEGIAFVNSRDEWLMRMASRLPHRIEYPAGIALAEGNYFVSIRDNEGNVFQTRLFGEYNFDNIAAAHCIGLHFGVPGHEALQAIATYTPQNQRSQLIEQGQVRIILDAYNANPSSMEQAIQSFARLPQHPKMLILGDMLELGTYSQQAHEELGRLVASFQFDKVVLYGKEIQAALRHLPAAYYFPDKFSLHNWLSDQHWHGYHILIKGSRGMQLESVLPFIHD
jgi:UDP-N-acetylmuramoyl-tripeptide--D-alanyl-D-alanine ligase